MKLKSAHGRMIAVVALLVLVVLSATAFSTHAQTIVATIPVGDAPIGVAVNPATNRVYVANSTGTSVSVIRGASNSVDATVSVGRFPFGVGVNPTTNRIYVANQDSDTVSVIQDLFQVYLPAVANGASSF